MGDLKLWLLGPPRIEVDGEALRVDTRKATALLVYLAMKGEPQRRDTLAAMLWPESDDSHAKAALRRTLSTLKKALNGSWVSADRDVIALDRPWVDAEAFAALVRETMAHEHGADGDCRSCREKTERAADMYRGPFLQGFTLSDSPDFDDWEYFKGQELQRDYALALRQLVAGYRASGELELAIDRAHRLLALDTLNEAAHRELMVLYALTGRRDQAIQQYRDAVRILQEELGAPPLEETVELHERIKRGDLGEPAPRATPGPMVARSEAIPLVGRERELGQLGQSHAAAADGSRLLIIAGEPGVGKTRLAEEYIGSRAAAVLRGRSYPDEDEFAYRPWIDALRSGMRATARLAELDDVWLSETARLLPEILAEFPDVPEPAPVDDPAAHDRFVEGLSRTIGAMAAGSVPGIVFLDDLHFADEASIELLSYLIRRGPQPPLMVIAGWRTEGGRSMPAWAAGLPRERVGVLTLDRLSPPEVRSLAGAVGLDQLSDRLYRETEGLPLFIAEYLPLLREHREDPEWSLPSSIRQLLSARLASLSGAARQLLSAAAVLGRSFEEALLREVSGRSPEETVDGLEELLGAGMVRELEEDPSYDFSHEKLRELVLESTAQARVRLLHARAAEALARMPQSAQSLGRVARHLELGGEIERAAAQYVVTAEQARAIYAHEEALANYRRALALGSTEHLRLHEGMGDTHTLIGDYEQAAQRFEAAAAYAGNGDLVRLEHKLARLYDRWGKWRRAEQHFQAAAEEAGEEAELAEVYADWSLTAHRRGDVARSEELIGLARNTASDDATLARVHNAEGILARSQGDLGSARQSLERSLELVEGERLRSAALNNLALVLLAEGDLKRAEELTREALELSERQGDRHRAAALHSNLADIYHRSGDRERAEHHLRRSAALFTEVGASQAEPEIWKLVEW